MSEINRYDIREDDIRVIGQEQPTCGKAGDTVHKVHEKRFPRWMWMVLLLLLSLLPIGMFMLFRTGAANLDMGVVYQNAPTMDTLQAQMIVGEHSVRDEKAHCIVTRQTVDDIPLRLLTPTGGHAELVVGELDANDASIVLAAQAADYRRDNGKIAGAFIYRGELLSRGHPKLGFCAIVGREVTMGMGAESPLFERAVEHSGYFFRQYSLVHNGELGENTPPGKSIRRALCYDGSHLFLVDTEQRESLHDFAQALLGMGVQEAISLVGSIQLPLYEDENGNRIVEELPQAVGMTETYIVWKK